MYEKDRRKKYRGVFSVLYFWYFYVCVCLSVIIPSVCLICSRPFVCLCLCLILSRLTSVLTLSTVYNYGTTGDSQRKKEKLTFQKKCKKNSLRSKKLSILHFSQLCFYLKFQKWAFLKRYFLQKF